MRRVFVLYVSITVVLFTPRAHAALTASGEVAPLGNGTNVLAMAAVNDSAGSSDLSLIVQLTADGKILIDEGHPVIAIVPTENIPSDDDPTGWTAPDFDDVKDWEKGEQGIGYGDGDDNLIIGDGQHAMVYARMEFEVRNPKSIKTLELGADFDDGCVIWINGVEVAREAGTDIPDKPEWDSWTDQGSGHSHEASKQNPPLYETVKIAFKPVASILAVEPSGKLATMWAAVKAD